MTTMGAMFDIDNVRAPRQFDDCMTTPSPRRLSRTRFGLEFSEGARKLWLAIGLGGITAAAERIGCSKGTLTHWLYGDRRPSAEKLTLIEDIYGVPASDWGRPPTEQFVLPAVESNEDDRRQALASDANDADDTGPHARPSPDLESPTGTHGAPHRRSS